MPGQFTLPDKYRPKVLADICGQREAVALLRASVAGLLESNSSAAFIFHGPSGVGKTSAAWAIANHLGCAIDDMMGGVSEIPSGLQDGAAVDRLLQGLRLRPLLGSGWRVIIVNEADQMTRQAEAIWLDGLENLPPRSVVIFTTNELSSFGARFVSRCQLVEFTGDPKRINGALGRYMKRVYRRETGKVMKSLPSGLGVLDIDGGTVNFRLALQQLAPYCLTGAKLPASFRSPTVRDSDSVRSDVGRAAARKAWETRRAAGKVVNHGS